MRSEDSTKSKVAADTEHRGLPLGTGYKSCWMVVEGASQKEVMDAFLQGRKMKYPYQDGLEKVAKARSKENKLLITATHKKQNYIIGTPVSQFFYDTEEFLAKCQAFPRVYVYMSHRVSEVHGFALVEQGKLVRFFKYDENGIENIGSLLPEEIALGYRLPHTFEDVRNEEANFTEVNEDMLVNLAISQVGIDVEQYPYKDVRVGKRFEYAADLAKDPYPNEKDEVSEDTWNLPEVQRFSAAKTYREKLEIVREIKDELTHPMIDVFGDMIETCAGYGRLSDRTDELCCILQDLADTEEKTITQEEFLNELTRGSVVFEDKIFDKTTFEGISCKKLTFHKCSFHHVQFGSNQIKQLEMNDCRFANSVFSGILQIVLFTLYNNFFWKCKIHDLVLPRDSSPLEMIDCRFAECEFTDITIDADFRMSDGWFSYCTGDTIHIKNIREDDTEKKPWLRENHFKNCYINGILQQ